MGQNDLLNSDILHNSHITHSNPFEKLLSSAERIAILETKFDQIANDQIRIQQQLDELLQLKHKGMGAIWLVGLIIGTGLIGLVSTIMGLFNKGHL